MGTHPIFESDFDCLTVMVKSEMAIEEGSPLRIECTLDAILTDLKYKRVNDKKLRNIFTKTAKKEIFFVKQNDWKSSIEDGKLILTKSNVQLEDSGTYYCSDSIRKNTTIDINVFAKPATSIKFRSNLSAKEDTPLEIGTCYALGSSNMSDVYWLDQNGKKYFGESSIEKDSKNRYEVKNTLTIKASYEIHQNAYRCVIEHQYMEQWTSGLSDSVNISWKPRNVKIETPRNTLDLAAYEQYELICSADANPPASFTWKIRHPNTTNPVLKHWNFNQGHVLSTESLAKSDSGVLITCEAINSLGKASRETQLQVSEAMRFGGLSSMTVLISLGALLLLIFVVFFTAFILKLLRQRKTTVYKTGNVRSSSSSSDKIKFGEGQQV